MPKTKSSMSINDLDNDDAVVIITRESLNLILGENASLQQKMLDLNQNVQRTLDRLAAVMETMTQQAATSNSSLHEKLDKLINSMSNNNATTSHFDVESVFKRRKEILQQKCRSEKLSNYYEELLDVENPFVRKQFRTRVNKNTPEHELIHRRQQSIMTVKTEISIMKVRVTRCMEKQKQLDDSIQNYLEGAAGEMQRKSITERVVRQEAKIYDDYVNHQLAFFKKIDDAEKETISEFLTKTVDTKPPRTQNPRHNFKRPPWRGRSHHGFSSEAEY